jgi:hypothetical protein
VLPIVGEDEGRHDLTGTRRALARTVLLEPSNQALNGISKGSDKGADSIGEVLESFIQRRVHVARVLKGVS